MTKKTYWAMNRHNKTAVLLTGFDSFEHVQGCFRVGIRMPDGEMANGIGRSKSTLDFITRAELSGFRVLGDLP